VSWKCANRWKIDGEFTARLGSAREKIITIKWKTVEIEMKLLKTNIARVWDLCVCEYLKWTKGTLNRDAFPAKNYRALINRSMNVHNRIIIIIRANDRIIELSGS